MSEGNFEAKVYAKRENAAGIYLTLQINPADFTSDLATLRVGSALLIGWAEVINSKVETIVLDPAPAKERKPFASLELVQQAGIRCADPEFQKFLNTDEAGAVDYVRQFCGVSSRAEIKADKNSGKDWVLLEAKFQQWLTDERYANMTR